MLKASEALEMLVVQVPGASEGYQYFKARLNSGTELCSMETCSSEVLRPVLTSRSLRILDSN